MHLSAGVEPHGRAAADAVAQTDDMPSVQELDVGAAEVEIADLATHEKVLSSPCQHSLARLGLQRPCLAEIACHAVHGVHAVGAVHAVGGPLGQEGEMSVACQKTAACQHASFEALLDLYAGAEVVRHVDCAPRRTRCTAAEVEHHLPY